jgi:hypothetical protein
MQSAHLTAKAPAKRAPQIGIEDSSIFILKLFLREILTSIIFGAAFASRSIERRQLWRNDPTAGRAATPLLRSNRNPCGWS